MIPKLANAKYWHSWSILIKKPIEGSWPWGWGPRSQVKFKYYRKHSTSYMYWLVAKKLSTVLSI